jgi:neutral ceramidase
MAGRLPRILVAFLGLTALLAGPSTRAAAAAGFNLRMGAAVRDITPSADMLPLTRAPNVELVGVLDPIHVRVLALSSGAATTLLVCAETGRSLGPQLARELSRHTHVPLEAILFTSTHSHAAPEIAGNWLNLVDPKERASVPASEAAVVKVTNQQRWAIYAQAQLLAAADEALAHMQSAAVGIGYAESYINVNRNAVYNKTANGKTSEVVALGFNPTGPSDKTVAAMRFNDDSGKPLAFIVNYAVHGTVMHANTNLNGKTGISADIPGMISSYLEQKYPGAVAVWLSGAAGDQAPLFQNQMLTRNPLTGELDESFSNSYDMLKYLSRIHFADVETALSRISRFEHNVQVNYDYRDANIPAKAGGDYGISLQLLRIGEIALVGFPGELFSTLGKDIKQGSALKHTIVVNHAWQRPYQHPGYHADDAAIERGGFGTDAQYKPGYLSKALVKLTNDMIRQTTDWTFNGDGTASSRNGQRVIVGADGIAGTADDNQIVNPAGTVLRRNVKVLVDADGVAYVALGNGFNLYAGQDSELGTDDDVVRGFGHYPQSDPTGAKADPLNWRLLDIQGDKAILLADAQLDSIQFNSQVSDGNDYVRSNLRAWLNSRGGRDFHGDAAGFYNVAFSDAEKAKIIPTRLNQPAGPPFAANTPETVSPRTYTTAPMDIQDPVWALSGEEAIRYFGPTKRTEARQGGGSAVTSGTIAPTNYARARGVKINVGGNGPETVGYGDSWLRTAGVVDSTTSYGIFLSSLGNLNGHRPVTNVYGELPAVTVRLGGGG